MTSDRSRLSRESGRVVQLRPRGATPAGDPADAGVSRGTQPKTGSAVDDLARYQRTNDDGGDDRRQMRMNILALSFCVLLIVAGLWLAKVIAEMRAAQDCVLSGRHGCGSVHGAISDPR